MATVGHLAAGALVARLSTKQPLSRDSIAAYAYYGALAMLPDVDFFGMALFHIPYRAGHGHRGMTHSLLFALVVAPAIAWVITRRVATFGSFRRVALASFFALASHGFLDGLTDGGLGIAYFWPLSLDRHFLPWRFISVGPLGTRIFSIGFVWLAIKEALLFLPIWIWSFVPARDPSQTR